MLFFPLDTIASPFAGGQIAIVCDLFSHQRNSIYSPMYLLLSELACRNHALTATYNRIALVGGQNDHGHGPRSNC
jgi:hypothetical protein